MSRFSRFFVLFLYILLFSFLFYVFILHPEMTIPGNLQSGMNSAQSAVHQQYLKTGHATLELTYSKDGCSYKVGE